MATTSTATSKAIEALWEAKPPATDQFSYLTIIESHLSPDILPTLNEILQDAELTQAIGWDLVHNLVSLPGCETCLETVARLGNPREVIIKVLETLELLGSDEDEQGEGVKSQFGDYDGSTSKSDDHLAVSKTQQFITLLGMLAILHKRISTKYPSRFLGQTLQVVYRTYRPNQEMTASVINLVRSLSGRSRPPLPTRKSSVNVANPDQDGDEGRNAPDPEGEKNGKDGAEDPTQSELKEKLLLSFVLCILEVFVNGNDLAWAARLVEFYQPDKLVPGKKLLMAAFREDQDLLARDAIAGQLVALTKDLGLTTCSKIFLNRFLEGPASRDPLTGTEDVLDPSEIKLSTGGSACLLAYWAFSSTIFDADQPKPDLHIFQGHFKVLEGVLQDDAEGGILSAPGTVQAIVALGLWLESQGRVLADVGASISKPTTGAEDPSSDFMSYLHSLTLIAVYHPDLHVRNATIVLAGHVLHANPSDEDRLRILEDLLENCTFANLKACAVTWLREELLLASSAASSGSTSNAIISAQSAKPSSSLFAGPAALEAVQYALFPRTVQLREQTDQEASEYVITNLPYLLATTNLGLFLWSTDKWSHIIPSTMTSTTKDRWFDPLRSVVDRLVKANARQEGNDLGDSHAADEAHFHAPSDMKVLQWRLHDLAESGTFKGLDLTNRA